MEFEKYHKLKRLGDEENKDIFSYPEDEIIIQEKIDGANFRFYIQNGKIIFGSRTREIGEEPNGDEDKNFRRAIEYVREQINDKDLSKYEGLIFYGENCVRHTMAYDWESIPPFLGFDIKTETGYLHYSNVETIFNELGLEIVPLLDRVYAKDIELPITDTHVPISKYASPSSEDQQAEGIVFKNYDKQIFGKYVRDKFKEMNSKVFGGSPKYNKVDDTDNSEFVFKYVTNARIEKLILKEIDNGEKMSMKLMGTLIKNTYLDIIEEEWKDILTSNWKLDFKKIRKNIAPRVRAVLEQMIDNNLINNKNQ
jgi:hypothetical protein